MKFGDLCGIEIKLLNISYPKFPLLQVPKFTDIIYGLFRNKSNQFISQFVYSVDS